jgi:tRNA(Ile)-lysidine synthase
MLPPLLTRLKTQVERHEPTRLVVGFSGGLDSSALLQGIVSLNIKNSKQQKVPVIAVHVHHGLSDNADDWLAHCQQVCDSLLVEFIGERVSLADTKGSLENAARSARYDVFKTHIQIGDILLLAHHQDDQVETFMMRLMRGSGLTGLSSMLTQRSFAGGIILRPWLTSTRAELETYVAKNNIHFIEDESNTDTQFDRNWWRQYLLPNLFKRYPQASNSIIRTIDVLQQERQVLNDLLEPIYKTVINWEPKFTQSNILNSAQLLRQRESVQIQLVRMWLESEGAYPSLNSYKIKQIIKDVVKAKEDAAPVYQWGDQLIRRYAGCLYVMKKNTPLTTVTTKEICITHGINHVSLTQGQLFIKPMTDNIDSVSGLKQGDYIIGYYSGSLLAKPFKRPSKSLKRWFQEYNVPPWLRTQWPIILHNNQVACVPGLFVAENFLSDKGLEVSYLAINLTTD